MVGDKIWVLVIENDYGNNVYVAHSKETLDQIVLNYVNEWWEEELPWLDIPEDPEAAVWDYFDNVDREYYNIDLIEVKD